MPSKGVRVDDRSRLTLPVDRTHCLPFPVCNCNCNIAEEYPNITPYAALDPGDKPAYVSGLLSHQIAAPKEDTWTGPDDLGFARIPARLCLALGLGDSLDSSPGCYCDPFPRHRDMSYFEPICKC